MIGGIPRSRAVGWALWAIFMALVSFDTFVWLSGKAPEWIRSRTESSIAMRGRAWKRRVSLRPLLNKLGN